MGHAIGYFCELYGVEDGPNEFRLAKHTGGDYVLLASMEYDWTPGEEYYIRIRAEGEDIKAKVWADGESEPEDWNLEVEDDEFEEGLTGIGSYRSDGERLVDFFGMGFFGNEAPTG